LDDTRWHTRLVVSLLAAALLAGCAGSHAADQVATTTTAKAPTTTTTEAPLAAGRQISVYVPSVGDCFDNRTAGTPPTTTEIVLLLACALPHENQVYATLDYPPSPAFPGTGVLEAYAKSHCVANFAAFVGKPYETSMYGLAYQLPTEASWGNGIRHVLGCLLVDPQGGRLTGTAQGSAK
jgi:Septum formation